MDKELLEYKVLLVEDDLDVLQKVGLRLKRYFKEVYEAKDGKQGLELYKAHKPHILFVDINLPKLSGIELLKIIREQDHTTKAVMLTAHSDVEFLLQASELKLTKYIVKPLTRDALSETIKMLLNELGKFNIRNIQTLTLKDHFLWSFEKKELTKDGKIVQISL